MSPALALIPGSMAVVTVMIVVLHVLVNLDDLSETTPMRRTAKRWMRRISDLFKNKN
ncbi:hypothetical protein [Bdellovibrio sp.]|uniref:hypothetical protein n=1 Tax=Bdellovibrio TaxID=958 RepID=UPI003221A2A6